LKVQEIIFLSWAKHIRGISWDFLRGPDLFDPEDAVPYAQDNLVVKKISAPSKNPSKCPILCFAFETKILSWTFKISGTFLVINMS
jgi:hypothetical protein